MVQQLNTVEGGLLAAKGTIALEHMDSLEHDFLDIFLPNSTLVLPPVISRYIVGQWLCVDFFDKVPNIEE